MGTMMGIVIGLFNMPEMGAIINDTKAMDLKLNEGIGLLIGGVKIAMIASFIGLFFTIINSGWVFKGSRSFSESRKNEFYTFIQIELLPLINQGLASTLESLQRNLLKFNNEFTSNLKGLTGIFDASRSAIKEQKELLDALDRAKVSDMTRYNVAVLKQLDVSVGQFEKFNAYLTNVTQFVENSQSIVSRTNELLARTDNFKNIADNLENKLNQSQLLMQFLSEHFNKLNEHKEFTSNAVADVGHLISETFKELKEHIQNSSESVKQFTVDETELLKTALSASKTNLGNLEHLSTLKTDVSQFKNSSASQGERLKQSIDDLNRNMAKSIAVLEQIEKHSFSNRAKNITTSIKNLFKSK
jgi:methyl-accepting chemotaxis protein